MFTHRHEVEIVRIVGVGPGNSVDAITAHRPAQVDDRADSMMHRFLNDAHSDHLQVATETGLLSLMLFMSFWALVLNRPSPECCTRGGVTMAWTWRRSRRVRERARDFGRAVLRYAVQANAKLLRRWNRCACCDIREHSARRIRCVPNGGSGRHPNDAQGYAED